MPESILNDGPGLLRRLQDRFGPGLVVVAAPVEAPAVRAGSEPPEPWRPCPLDGGGDLVLSGVGKALAAGAAARCWRAGEHRWLLSAGIAGTLGGGPHALGRVLAAEVSVFADEGVERPGGFSDLAAMGFAPLGGARAAAGGMGVAADAVMLDAARAHTDGVGVVATVSTCSGTAERAAEVARRTGARAEAMEGAAVGAVAVRLGAPFLEVRAISNTTGDRGAQVWDVPGAVAALRRALLGGAGR